MLRADNSHKDSELADCREKIANLQECIANTENSLTSANQSLKKMSIQSKLDENEKQLLARMNESLSVRLSRAEEAGKGGNREYAQVQLQNAASELSRLESQLQAKSSELLLLKGSRRHFSVLSPCEDTKKLFDTCETEPRCSESPLIVGELSPIKCRFALGFSRDAGDVARSHTPNLYKTILERRMGSSQFSVGKVGRNDSLNLTKSGETRMGNSEKQRWKV